MYKRRKKIGIVRGYPAGGLPQFIEVRGVNRCMLSALQSHTNSGSNQFSITDMWDACSAYTKKQAKEDGSDPESVNTIVRTILTKTMMNVTIMEESDKLNFNKHMAINKTEAIYQ